MPEISVRNWKNETVRTLELDPAVFDYPLKKHLVYEAVLAYQAAGRRGTHKTKNRVEVSGGTRKLWRQKHTGRARVGDNRSPLWRHGGTVHGPDAARLLLELPQEDAAATRLRSALAQTLRDGKHRLRRRLRSGIHRTKDLEQALGGGLGITGKALLVPVGERAQPGAGGAEQPAAQGRARPWASASSICCTTTRCCSPRRP